MIGAQSAITAVSAFNLICAGTWIPAGKVIPPHPFTTVIRVDLSKQRWCRGECLETKPIFSMSETNLVLEYTVMGAIIDKTIISRESGDYQSVSTVEYNGETIFTGEFGNCKIEEFSGFPQRKF